MSPTAPTPQTTAARRTAEVETRAIIARFAPEHERLVGAVRRRLRKRLPSAHELVYAYRTWFVISFSPNAHGYEGVLALRGDADGVKLFINRSKGLPDPEKLLQGSGAQARWIAVESASVLTRPAVGRLMDEAIARSTVKFAATGRGPVVIQSSGTKTRARRRSA